MALFKPYQRPDEKAAKPASEKKSTEPRRDDQGAEPTMTEPVRVEQSAAPKAPVKKDAPTPTRKEAERLRMERLHPKLSPKERKRAERAAKMQAQNEAFLKAESAPEKKLLRDFVDSRFHITEAMLPLMLIVLSTIFFYQWAPWLMQFATYATWGLLALMLIEIVVTWLRFKKVLAARLPGTPTRGLLTYMINRLMQIRRFRTPAPAIKRGDKF